MKKTFLMISVLLCCSAMFAWEWEKEGDTVTILPNEKSTFVSLSEDAPWFNSEYENLNIVIGDGITAINDEVFKGSQNIVSVTFSNTVETIGKESFANCPKLENVELSESLLTINDKAFFDCPLLNNVIVPGTETVMGDNVFSSSDTTSSSTEEEIDAEVINSAQTLIDESSITPPLENVLE